MQTATRHLCMAFAYSVSCIIGTYLNVYVKALETDSVLDLGGKIPILF